MWFRCSCPGAAIAVLVTSFAAMSMSATNDGAQRWTIHAVLDWTQGRFASSDLPTARLDAEVLLAHVLQKPRIFLYTHFDLPLEALELEAYRVLVRRRLAGTAVAYLVGKKEFRSLELLVDERVLIPRPDSETLIDVALERVTTAPQLIVDVGTGSGAIALALKRQFGAARVIAIDESSAALAVAQQNSERLGLPIECRQGDLLGPINEPVELIVSNPPYIPSADIAALPAEVRGEPQRALDGGEDGLVVLRRLCAEAAAKLTAQGHLIVECGAGQAARVAALFAEHRFADVQRKKDLGGIERVVSGVLV